jgi:hypothetical protein
MTGVCDKSSGSAQSFGGVDDALGFDVGRSASGGINCLKKSEVGGKIKELLSVRSGRITYNTQGRPLSAAPFRF